jgi:hypothetical protein
MVAFRLALGLASVLFLVVTTDSYKLIAGHCLSTDDQSGRSVQDEHSVSLPHIDKVKAVRSGLNRVGKSAFKGPYLGQQPPGMTPVIFAEGFISVPGYAEFGCSFTPDGNEFYYTIGGNPDKIYFTRQTADGWTDPVIAPFCAQDTTHGDFEPFVIHDGSRMFFSSNRLSANSSAIYTVGRTGDGWESTPVSVGSPVNDDFAMFISISRQGTAYYSGPNDDIYKSTYADGVFSTPIPLDYPVNLQGYTDGHPCVAPDESYLIFDSNRPGGFGGFDMWVCFKRQDGSWSDPVDLGDKVNDADFSGTAMITPDCKYLFFSWYSDLYWVDARIIKALSPTDLECGKVSFKPRAPLVGDSVKTTAIVRNAGDTYSVTSDVSFYLSKTNSITKKSTLLGMAILDSLKPGSKIRVTLDFKLSKKIAPGSYYLLADVDAYGFNADPDKTDNTAVAKRKVMVQ